MVDIRAVSAEDVRPIRQRVLRPHQQAEELVYPGDDGCTSFHLGAYLNNELVGILSMYRQARDGQDDGWRIRGMATIPEARGTGLGRLLVEHARSRAWATEGTEIWCNARESAFGFYHALGFEIVGDLFEIEAIGPHAVMVLHA